MRHFDAAGFSAAIRGRRKMRGLTLREAATQCGISPATVNRIEQGEMPCMDTAVALCDWLELPIDAFVRIAQ